MKTKSASFEPTTCENTAEITNAAVRLLAEAETAIRDTKIRRLPAARLENLAKPGKANATMTLRKTVTRERAE